MVEAYRRAMQTTRETLEHIRPLFAPDSRLAIGVVVTDVIRGAGGLSQLATAMQACAIHPDFEGRTKSQIAELERLPIDLLRHHTSFDSGPVERHVTAMCQAHEVDPSQLQEIVASPEGPLVAPTLFYNRYTGRLMMTGHLSVVSFTE